MRAAPAQAFLSLFAGYDKAYGQWDPSKPRRSAAITVSEQLTLVQVEAHLQGKMGLGIVPIREDDTVSWGVLDVDAHEDAHHIDLAEAEAQVAAAKLPLMVCQSKSHGAHLFLFLKKPLAARLVQTVLKDWAKKLSIPLRQADGTVVLPSAGPVGGLTVHLADGTAAAGAVVEVFPKQIKQQGVGNWLNLPYLGSDKTERFAQVDGQKLTLAEFLAAAERIKQDRTQILQAGDLDLSQAPPCLESLWEKGVPTGSRDNALVAFGTFFKMQGVGDIYMALQKVNSKPGMMSPRPLLEADVKKVAASVQRRDYRYRCNESPICDMCDSAVCKTRAFGIKVEPTKEYTTVAFGQLQKILTLPPRWQLMINGMLVDLLTEDLMAYDLLRKKVIESHSAVLPPKKQEDWLVELSVLLEHAEEVEAPEDATATAMIVSMLADFTVTAEEKAADATFASRAEILRGLPIVMQDRHGIPVVAFRSQDFMAFLKRKKIGGMERGQDLWMVMKKAGCDHERILVESRKIQVWTKPLTQPLMEHEIPVTQQDF